MAEPLKNLYGQEIPHRIADMISNASPIFDRQRFLDYVLPEYDGLELMPRGWHMADGLKHALPEDYETAIDILLASLPPARPPVAETSATADREGNTLAPFIFMPHTFFVARYGLNHFDASMRAQYELTQRFTAEFSIRPFLQQFPERTLKVLRGWTEDSSEHVRRLVSEGTRPRLPWASRLPAFQKNPEPVLSVLELLKDDPSLYVRRSVANNLNDIGKDNPDHLFETAERWLKNASPDREWIISHALRVAIKNGEPRALRLIGFGSKPQVSLSDINITPDVVTEGDSLAFSVTINSKVPASQSLLIDFVVHYLKANGSSRGKVFKLTRMELDGKQSVTVGKRISLKPMTTRKHYAGEHRLELLINGTAYPLGSFSLVTVDKPLVQAILPEAK
ncbi:MAG: DNA alkylation repair protein [Gammaproteobacteria bacterium]|nr:DNA alkylation repair protein [Gammaproteobacteria bacterium]MBJ53795.1 DNA alkylation repair protein [Gammaproteobacteria bacterium]HBN13592.1 DNA alkylation repair protein [Pseudohongiella sp.]|tara:strand:- start:808 stop:1989 length:1182 start_codon:yes stop_codon:yes gene_type:complete